jgi:MFS family permease
MVGFLQPPCEAGVIRATPAFEAALTQRRKRLTLAATIVGSSMAFIDGSVVNIALPAMQHALNATVASTQWIVNAYLLLLGALVLVGGAAADLYGRRRIFLIGLAVFTAASIACGLAPNVSALIVSRAIQGVGAALLVPASLAMLGATFDEHERSHAIGIWAGVAALTSAIGPVLGGWLVDAVSWRAIFLLNVPLAVVAAGLAAGFACESRDDNAKALDWAGAAMVGAGLAAITWGLSAIPASGLYDRTVLGALGSGFVFLVLFLAVEARSGQRAMMPLSLYRSRDFSAANALTLLLYFALGGAFYYLPFGLIRLGGHSATQAGAALLPFSLIMGLARRWRAALRPLRTAAVAGLRTHHRSLRTGAAGVCRFPAILLGPGFSGDLPVWRRHDHHRSAADLDGDVVRGRSPRRGRLGRQQRGRPGGRPLCRRRTRCRPVRELLASSCRGASAASQRSIECDIGRTVRRHRGRDGSLRTRAPRGVAGGGVLRPAGWHHWLAVDPACRRAGSNAEAGRSCCLRYCSVLVRY